jgi:IS30 family transposase
VGERLSELERWRIAELAAQGLPSRVIGREIGRSHRAVWRYLRVAATGSALFTAGPAFGDSSGSKVCSPGQQGNPHPGFKPGSC